MNETTTTPMMPAWRRETYGPADGFRLEQIPVPVPRRGEVVLRVEATSLNAGDVRLMLGDPLLVRPIYGLTRPKHPVRGMEVVGTVVAVGPQAIGAELGERVVGELVGGGGLASHVAVPASRLVPIRPDVTAEAAACLPVAGGTAWQALERGAVASGHRVLVIGASGGVGTFAVQLAALRGAEVWALCGERNRTLVEELGAARTFDYRSVQPGSPELGDGRFDAVIDIAGTAPLRDLQRLVRAGGAVVLVSGEGGRVLGPVGRILGAALRSIGSKRPLRPLAAVAKTDVLSELVGLAASGALKPVIERTYPFADARAALAHVDAGHTVGKVVVIAG